MFISPPFYLKFTMFLNFKQKISCPTLTNLRLQYLKLLNDIQHFLWIDNVNFKLAAAPNFDQYPVHLRVVCNMLISGRIC